MSDVKYFLTSERLGFRWWTKDDFDLACKLWGSYQVTKFIDARGQLTDEQITEKLNTELETSEKYNIQYWPVFLLSCNEFIGCCGLRPYDLDNKIYETGVHLLPDYWGKGLATEAIKTVMEYAFSNLKAKALFAGHNPKNTVSKRMLLKAGFNYSFTKYYPPTGLHHPSYLMTFADYSRLVKRERKKQTGKRI